MKLSLVIEASYATKTHIPDFSLLRDALGQLDHKDGALYAGTIYQLKGNQVACVYAEDGRWLHPLRSEDVEVSVEVV